MHALNHKSCEMYCITEWNNIGGVPQPFCDFDDFHISVEGFKTFIIIHLRPDIFGAQFIFEG